MTRSTYDFYIIPTSCGCTFIQLHNDSDTLPMLYEKYRNPCVTHRGLYHDEITDAILATLTKKTEKYYACYGCDAYTEITWELPEIAELWGRSKQIIFHWEKQAINKLRKGLGIDYEN